jgi:crotonobetainyl-CoA:carnitine CoA-transferase CaiB-like acyl-CoA transferase
MVVELEQPGAPSRCGCSACRSSSRARPATRRAPGPALGEHTDGLLEARLRAEEIEALLESGAVRRRRARRAGTFLP